MHSPARPCMVSGYIVPSIYTPGMPEIFPSKNIPVPLVSTGTGMFVSGLAGAYTAGHRHNRQKPCPVRRHDSVLDPHIEGILPERVPDIEFLVLQLIIERNRRVALYQKRYGDFAFFGGIGQVKDVA